MSGKNPKGVLSPTQQKVLSLLKKQSWFSQQFYLTGGTALSAYYLNHRLSDDLDFFTHQPFPPRLASLLVELCTQDKISIASVQETPMFHRFKANGSLQLDFVQDTQIRFGTPVLHQDLPVDNLENIAVNKVLTILGRLDIKDYVDLYFLLTVKNLDIFELLEKGKKKDPGCDMFTWSRLIADVHTLQALPKMQVKLDLKKLHRFFGDLQIQILKKLKPSGG